MVVCGFSLSKIRRREAKVWRYPIGKSEKERFSADEQSSPLRLPGTFCKISHTAVIIRMMLRNITVTWPRHLARNTRPLPSARMP